MRVAARIADYWSWDGPIERYAPLVEELQRACAEVGRDWSTMGLHAAGEAYFPAQAADFPEPADPTGTMASVTAAQDPVGLYADEADWVLGPTPADAIAALQPLVDLEVTMFSIYFHDRRSLDMFAREVVPAFGVAISSDTAVEILEPGRRLP